jgi:exosortase C (VPDSG-CTERM-specific)
MAGSAPGSAAGLPRQSKRLAGFTILLVIGFGSPLLHLFRFALASQLYSYILLIPFIAVYLGWIKKGQLAISRPAPLAAAAFGTIALILLGLAWNAFRSNWLWTEEDRLCALILSFVFFLISGCAALMGTRFLRLAGFPLGFLLFMAPLPSGVENALEAFLQHRSADAAYLFLNISGTPVFRDDTTLRLPGITLQVAPECSGIRSSLVLMLASLLAGHFFFKRTASKAILVASVLVLGVLRNAFRIFTLAQLCIHISPSIIDSPLHHRGGPIFFAISLVPFFFLIWYLRKVEIRKSKRKAELGN